MTPSLPEHSPLAPSSAYRWVFCNGSVQLEAQFPEPEEDESAAEGTAAHWAGAEMLLGRKVAAGQIAPNGVVLTDEMIDGADMWVEDVQSVGAPASELQVEQRVRMPRIHGQAYGTPDTWLYVPTRWTVYVWDFKFGHGVVEHFENWQLIAYVCGILDLLGIDGRNDQNIWVELRVVQPRAFHREGRVRTWRVKASDLRGYFNRLHHAAHDAMGAGATTVTGPWCLHCKAAAGCATLRKAITHAADWSGTTSAELLPAEDAAYELELLEHVAVLIKARLKGRSADAESRLRRGENFPGWCLETTYGRLDWKDGEEADVLLMGDMYEVDLRKPAKPVTPKQAEKLCKAKGVDTSVIREYSHTPRTGVVLARDTNLLNRARAGFGVKLEQ